MATSSTKRHKNRDTPVITLLSMTNKHVVSLIENKTKGISKKYKKKKKVGEKDFVDPFWLTGHHHEWKCVN